MILVRTPPGVALYKLVLIKPADDPNFAPDEGFSDLVFWFDPDFNGHSSGIKPVYPQPLPVSVSKVQPAVVEKAEPPASDMQGRIRVDGNDLVDRTHKILAVSKESSRGGDAWQREHAIESRRFVREL